MQLIRCSFKRCIYTGIVNAFKEKCLLEPNNLSRFIEETQKLRETEQYARCSTYPDDVIVRLGLFVSPFRLSERPFVCQRRALCDGRINDAVVGAAIGRAAWRLDVQRSPVVHLVLAERLHIECAGVAWISIVPMRRLARTWSGWSMESNKVDLWFLYGLAKWRRDLWWAMLRLMCVCVNSFLPISDGKSATDSIFPTSNSRRPQAPDQWQWFAVYVP